MFRLRSEKIGRARASIRRAAGYAREHTAMTLDTENTRISKRQGAGAETPQRSTKSKTRLAWGPEKIGRGSPWAAATSVRARSKTRKCDAHINPSQPQKAAEMRPRDRSRGTGVAHKHSFQSRPIIFYRIRTYLFTTSGPIFYF